MLIPFFILAITLVCAFGLISIYNNLVRARVHADEGWSGIDVQLRRRSDLIPNLINTVKGYMAHEGGLLQQLTELRTQSLGSHSVKEQNRVEDMLTTALRSVIAVAENYPDLKANQNFKNLQDQLGTIEHELQLARRYYNGTVRENNILIHTFPSNVIAQLFNFTERDFFEVESVVRDRAPEVNFK